MSLELMFVIGLWVLALAMTGVSILQEVRARQLRERVARLVRTRMPTEEEMPTEMPEDEELRQSIAQRLFRAFLLPWIQRLSRLLPQSGATLKGTEELLAMAGYPFGLTASDFMGLRLLCTFVGAALGVLLPIPLSLWRPDFFVPSLPLFAAAILAFAGFLGPVFWLRRAAMRRRHLIRRQLPDMLDLITLSIEAGLAFDGAVYEAARRFKGPLSDELMKVMREVTLGKPRAQALRDMAERLKLEDISLLVSAVHQAETLGSPLANSLKALGEELRKKRLRMIREQIAKLPVKLIFPLVLFIFPTLFIVILGPAVIQVMRTGLGGG
jgi:tight adherence protein C